MAGSGEPAPLSPKAEQMMAALDQIVDGQAVAPARWLLALLEADRALAGQVSGGNDLGALVVSGGPRYTTPWGSTGPS
jgi:hypothetical protein